MVVQEVHQCAWMPIIDRFTYVDTLFQLRIEFEAPQGLLMKTAVSLVTLLVDVLRVALQRARPL